MRKGDIQEVKHGVESKKQLGIIVLISILLIALVVLVSILVYIILTILSMKQKLLLSKYRIQELSRKKYLVLYLWGIKFL